MAEWLNSAFYGLDKAVTLWVNGLRCGFLNFISMLMAYLGKGGLFFIAASVVLLLFRKTRKAGLCSLLAIGVGALLVNVLLKPLVARPRPYTAGGEFLWVWERAGKHLEKEFSFPSGHTAASFAFAVAFAMTAPKKYSVPALVLACLISLSRLYVGVHYPTDILGGIVIGALCGILAVWIVKYIQKRCKKTF